jgi:hypothetical protein
MRGLLVPAIALIVALWAIDAFAFHGRYRAAAWLEASHQGQKLSFEIRHWLKEIGL